MKKEYGNTTNPIFAEGMGLRLGVCYFALQIFQVYHNFNRQNYSTKPLLVAGAVK